MFSFDLTPELKEGLELLKERDGVPVAESIRRAVRAWLEQKEALPQAAGRKAKRGGKR
jgi:predicted DNA-binding protein